MSSRQAEQQNINPAATGELCVDAQVVNRTHACETGGGGWSRQFHEYCGILDTRLFVSKPKGCEMGGGCVVAMIGCKSGWVGPQ